MVKLPSKNIERKLINSGYEYIIGIDEVGMGCLAGPVTACAVMISKDFYTKRYKSLSWLRESKLLQAKQRETYRDTLIDIPELRYTITSADVATIDTINIYQASRQAMHQCIQQLGPDVERSFMLIDGNKLLKNAILPQEAIVKGDRHIFAIAAASIIAKVHRDQLMREYAKEFPGYGFDQHKGYGTAHHRQKIRELGTCPLHRTSFKLTV